MWAGLHQSFMAATRDLDPDWVHGASPHLQVEGAQVSQGAQRINAVHVNLPHFQAQVPQLCQRAQLQHNHKVPSVAHP